MRLRFGRLIFGRAYFLFFIIIIIIIIIINFFFFFFGGGGGLLSEFYGTSFFVEIVSHQIESGLLLSFTWKYQKLKFE